MNAQVSFLVSPLAQYLPLPYQRFTRLLEPLHMPTFDAVDELHHFLTV